MVDEAIKNQEMMPNPEEKKDVVSDDHPQGSDIFETAKEEKNDDFTDDFRR